MQRAQRALLVPLVDHQDQLVQPEQLATLVQLGLQDLLDLVLLDQQVPQEQLEELVLQVLRDPLDLVPQAPREQLV